MTPKVDFISIGYVEGVATAGVSSRSYLKFMMPWFDCFFYGFVILNLPSIFTVKHDLECPPSELDSVALAH